MKAKEYASRYMADPTDEQLAKVAYDMYMEINELIIQRNAKSNAAVIAILNEINDKWRAFARLVPGNYIRPEGFAMLVKSKLPDIYAYWRQYRSSIRVGKL